VTNWRRTSLPNTSAYQVVLRTRSRTVRIGFNRAVIGGMRYCGANAGKLKQDLPARCAASMALPDIARGRVAPRPGRSRSGSSRPPAGNRSQEVRPTPIRAQKRPGYGLDNGLRCSLSSGWPKGSGAYAPFSSATRRVSRRSIRIHEVPVGRHWPVRLTAEGRPALRLQRDAGPLPSPLAPGGAP
jgi:hypothetical protein